MILVDTSVWVDHLRAVDAALVSLLESGGVLTHPFIIGEIACGNLRQRPKVIALLAQLPRAQQASDDEVLFFIESHRLMDTGIGYVDAHLLASVYMTHASVWTRDRHLLRKATRLKLSVVPDGTGIGHK